MEDGCHENDMNLEVYGVWFKQTNFTQSINTMNQTKYKHDNIIN